MTERLLVRGLNRSFGALVVSSDVNLSLAPGARTALIGPNGAGKTTLVNLITGALAPSSGEIRLDGRDITHMPQAARVRAGLVRTFQVTRLVRDLTVADNVRLALIQRHRAEMQMFRRVDRMDALDHEVSDILGTLELADRTGRRIRDLAYGEQRLIELALALALRPRVLLLDEPAAGVPQSESGIIMRAIEALPADLAVLFIEHDMDLVFRFAQRIIVLVAGAVLMEGTPDEVADDERVQNIYLGRSHHGGTLH